MNRVLSPAIALVALTLACSAPSGSAQATSGGACNTENAGACETPTRLLVCQNKIWVTASDCKGPDGCRLVDASSVECDFRGNSAGDLCASSSEGKVRCDPDGGVNILRCTGGTLAVEFTCPNTTLCSVIPDAGLSCR